MAAWSSTACASISTAARPSRPIAGGALDAERVALTAADGNRFLAFRARARGADRRRRSLILPDVRGLHPFYEELALRFAEHGIDALAIDYFGRTAGTDTPARRRLRLPRARRRRRPGPGCAPTSGRGAAALRSDAAARCAPCSRSASASAVASPSISSTLGLGLAGAIGFYGVPLGTHYSGMPAPVDVAGAMSGSILGLFGGADPSIPPDAVAAFDAALRRRRRPPAR